MQKWDDQLIDWFSKWDNKNSHALWRILSLVGDKGLIWLILISHIAAVRRDFLLFLWGGISMVGLFVVVDKLIKPAVARPRPSPAHRIAESDYSFPSGHAASTGLALVWMTAYLSGLAWSAAFVYGLLTVLSRVVLKRHYLSDVVGGVLIGVSVGLSIRLLI